jgi:hypothetical protein
MTASAYAYAPRGQSRYLLLALMTLVPAAASAGAGGIPSLRQGLWEYQRTVGAQRFAATQCVDPSEDLRHQLEAQAKMGCKFAPAQQDGLTYTYAADCALRLKSGVVTFSSVSVLTVANDSAYRMETRMTMRGETRSESITAQRVADCSR